MTNDPGFRIRQVGRNDQGCNEAVGLIRPSVHEIGISPSNKLVWASIDGTPEIVLWSQKETGPEWLYPMGFSPDGSVLSAFGPSTGTSFDLYLLDLNERDGKPVPREPELFLSNRFGECFGQISPDGHWMLFASDQSGQYEVYVTSYPKPGAIYQISRNGGREPLWNPGASEIDYLSGTQMYAVDVSFDSELRVGEPRRLFDGPFPDVPGFGYDVASDGKAFLMLQSKAILKPSPRPHACDPRPREL